MKHRYSLPLLLSFLFLGVNSGFAQLVTDNIFMMGQFLQVAIAPNGSWGNSVTVPAGYITRGSSSDDYTDPILHTAPSGNGMDFSYDSGHDGWTVGTPPWYGAYFLPGTPFDGWSIQVNGIMSSAFYTNAGYNNTLGGTLAGTVTSYTNTGGDKTGVWSGSCGVGSALQITQTNELDTTASWLIVTTKFVNTSGSTMPGVYYFVTADPDNDVSVGGSFPTNNHIAYQGDYYNRHEVWARPPSAHQDAFSGLAAKDCRVQAMIYVSWPPAMVTGNDLDLVWNHTATSMSTCYYAEGATTLDQDIAFGLIWKVGDIPAGDSAIISYAWIFSDTLAIDSAFPSPQLNIFGVRVDSLDTVIGCNVVGNTFNITIDSATTKDWSWSNWTWSPALGLSATTGTSITFNLVGLSGATTYTITGTKDTSRGGCGTKTFLLYVTPCFSATSNSMGIPSGGVFIDDAAGDSVICMNQTLTLTAHGDSTGATYFWYGPGGFTAFVQNTTRTGLTMADTGIYYVVKTVGTSSDTAHVRVFLKALPVVNATSNSPICSGATLNLSALPDSTNEKFTWSGPLGFTSTLEFPSISPAHVNETGIYKVVTSLRGCWDSGTVAVFIDKQ
jgi:hypothetical protein